MKKILYVDMDNVLVDFESAVARVAPDIQRRYAGRLDDIPGIFAQMDLIPHALEAFRRLSRHFDTYVLSTAPWENPSAWTDKLVWIKHHLGQSAYKRLILTHHKNLNKGHFLVDDRRRNGADRFEGEHIHFGSARFPDWIVVEGYLTARR